MLSRVAMENVATRLNTVGITYLRSEPLGLRCVIGFFNPVGSTLFLAFQDSA
jgi:hypothetical protein